ncbi:hypothetical protein DPX16_7160 [Anabarilius grahami]|uniref:DDE Tnp4 domain-containing protein n=1 Tax=Anabarilius grahami TaxID=495550 RepID=A0A3N0XFE4_ANAGA|nr:hypothetical protein DPX16_7160 [Anabarilius grahami]
MDERTFYRHLWVIHSQFVYLTEVLSQHGLIGDQHDEGVEIPLKQKDVWLKCFCIMVPTFVSWFTECKKMSTSTAFRAMCGINGVIGAIDGCHIKLQQPPVRGGDYLNRKCYYSVVLQGIVDGKGRFWDCHGSWVH